MKEGKVVPHVMKSTFEEGLHRVYIQRQLGYFHQMFAFLDDTVLNGSRHDLGSL